MTGGVPLTAACNLLFWFILATWMLGRPHAVEVVFPPMTYYVCLVLLLIGAPMSVFVGLIVAQALGKPTSGGRLRWSRCIGSCNPLRR